MKSSRPLLDDVHGVAQTHTTEGMEERTTPAWFAATAATAATATLRMNFNIATLNTRPGKFGL